MQCPISLTEAAIGYLRDILAENQDVNLRLRVYVSGGGCSGLQYGMALDTEVDPDDTIYDFEGIAIVLSAYDEKYLLGSIVDYVINNMGGGFKVENPNAVKSCGCGSSFSVEDDVAGRTLTGGCGSCSK
jgi:iron-sulfur cluster assembly accessory protein